jgi:hypothetical protein
MTRAAAFKDRRAEKAARPVRAAGKDAMRDPPQKWDELDEMIDESFAASHPPAFTSRGIKRKDDRVLAAERKKRRR